jgi:6,7-dimethyl-8-ribityllumazine synthase|tara:strand:+ start:164 stop:553 length:390 start_codon:yes stop_codon:yes gene_type:complete
MKKILIVTANYYPEICKELKQSALKNLKNFTLKSIFAPGVFEIPVIISKNISKFDAFIALGCVIKGETPHFDLISNSVTDGLMKISIETKKPIGNGILICFNKRQALARVNKGEEAANAVVQVLKNVPK